MTRREAREYAVCLFFEYSYNSDDAPDLILERVSELLEEKPSGFAKQLFFGSCENLVKIDERISKSADNWSLGRISRVSLAVLRICAYELMFTAVPPEIIINEGIELARKFDDESAVGFVNGVLGKLLLNGETQDAT